MIAGIIAHRGKFQMRNFFIVFSIYNVYACVAISVTLMALLVLSVGDVSPHFISKSLSCLADRLTQKSLKSSVCAFINSVSQLIARRYLLHASDVY